IEEADLVVLVGSNAAWCHPVLYQRLAAAKEARGTRVVVIDPRITPSCDIADLHLPVRPGTDVALLVALLLHLVENGLCDRDWIGARASGFAAALDAARSSVSSLAAAAAIADIDRVRRFWNAPRIATRPGLKAVELFDAVLDGRVKALWILGTNPAASMSRAARVRQALAACPFVVVTDCWPTDTTRFADV